jgi:hypothetical protein
MKDFSDTNLFDVRPAENDVRESQQEPSAPETVAGSAMEFYPREEISLSPFNLTLSSATLRDLITAGQLFPFKRASPRFHYGPPDPISMSYFYEPLFPSLVQARYSHLKTLRSSIWHLRYLLDQSDDEAWAIFVRHHHAYGTDPGGQEDFLRGRAEVLVDAQRQLAEMLPAAEELETEFPAENPYSGLKPGDWEDDSFRSSLQKAFFRRDQIERLRDEQKEELPFETLAQKVGGEAEALYKEIKRDLRYKGIDITDSATSQQEIYDALIEVLPALRLQYLGGLEIPVDLCCLKASNPKRSFVEKLIKLFAKSKGVRITQQEAGDLYFRNT